MTSNPNGTPLSAEAPAEGSSAPNPTAATSSKARGEVSATTVGMMLGLATTGELKLLDGKIDLLTTKMANLTTRMEKILSVLSTTPTGTDLERIDVQIGSLKSMLREFLTGSSSGAEPGERAKVLGNDTAIKTNTPATEAEK